MQRFQRAADAKGRILKAERVDPGRAGEPQRAVAFLLTFDVGRLLVSVDPDSADLTTHYLEPESAAPAGLVDAVEDEPWWRILGSLLVRVWLGEAGPSGGRGLRLQFREDDDNPRTVALDADGSLVCAGLDQAELRRSVQ